MNTASHIRSIGNKVNTRDTRLFAVAICVGALAAASALLFDFLYQAVHAFVFDGLVHLKQSVSGSPDFSDPYLWALPFIVAAGAMVSRGLAHLLHTPSKIHGTDTVIEAFHTGHGELSSKSSWLTILKTSLTLGTGGSAGMEGPMALVGASLGSTVGRLLRFDEKSRRLIMLMGVSAGLSAIFRAPVGAAFFAIEFLYRGMYFEAEALIYTLISAVAGYAIIGSVAGWSHTFALPEGIAVTDLSHFVWFALLGASAGVLSSIIPTVFYTTKNVFVNMKLHDILKPGLGGFLVGLIGIWVPQILGPGTWLVQDLMTQTAPIAVLILYMLLKIVTFSLTIGSGGSGGVFAPSLFIGAALGAVFAQLAQMPQAPMVLVGMATIFAAAGRTPITALLMVPEITGDYALLPPTALAVAISYLLQTLIAEKMRYPTLHSSQPVDLYSSPSHHEETLIAGLRLLQKGGVDLSPDVSLPDLRALLQVGHPVPLGSGDLLVIRGNISPASSIAGLKLHENPFGQGKWLLEIRRRDEIIFPEGITSLEVGDELVLLTSVTELTSLFPLLDFPFTFENWLARHEPEQHKMLLQLREGSE